MDEGRLKAVKKGQKLHRKFAYAMNDTIRSRQQYYQTCLTREEQEAHARLMTKVINIRRAVVRNRVLLQCLNLHRNNHQPDRAHTEPLLGSYGGRPIDSFTRDIDQRLAWFHPRLRRLRKVDRVRQSCLKQGEILDEETIKDRMEDFFTKNQDLYTPRTLGKPAKHSDDIGNHQRYHGSAKKTIASADEDDDDFDIRDYDNPITGANFKLRLHPFGNMVDFDNKGETKNFNLLTRRNVFVRSSDPSDWTMGSNALVDRNLFASSPSKKNNPGGLKNEPSSPRVKSLHSSPSPHLKSPPPRFSKYPDPLPPIESSSLPIKHKSKEVSSGDLEHLEKSVNKQAGRTETRPKKGDPQERLQDGKENVSSKSEDGGLSKLTRRKTLILPPLETTKDMVKN